MKKNIPLGLIYFRLLAGFVMVALISIKTPNYQFLAITLLSLGLLSDVFDGIIARKLNISTEKLRRLDSSIDQIFFLSVAVATYLECPAFFKSRWVSLVIILGLEAMTYLISFIRFRKEVATHSIGAKIWTLCLFATLIEVIIRCDSSFLFSLFFWIGVITRIEILGILLALRTWTNDVPSFYHSLILRKGKKIKRHKLFNG